MSNDHSTAKTREETTSEKQFRIKEDGFWPCLKRDIFVALYLWRLTWKWLTVGWRIRKAHREAQRTGNIYYIDNIMGGGDI